MLLCNKVEILSDKVSILVAQDYLLQNHVGYHLKDDEFVIIIRLEFIRSIILATKLVSEMGL